MEIDFDSILRNTNIQKFGSIIQDLPNFLLYCKIG